MHNPEIDALVELLTQLPGFGPRSARRAALYLLSHKENALTPLQAILTRLEKSVIFCESCFMLSTLNPCEICNDRNRNQKIICVVEETADVWALERALAHNGTYHILGGALNALEAITPENLNIEPLLKRVKNNNISEIILATNATIEGQATAHYLAELLAKYQAKLSRLARGMPLGGLLEYMDDGTIADAMRQRRPF